MSPSVLATLVIVVFFVAAPTAGVFLSVRRERRRRVALASSRPGAGVARAVAQ